MTAARRVFIAGALTACTRTALPSPAPKPVDTVAAAGTIAPTATSLPTPPAASSEPTASASAPPALVPPERRTSKPSLTLKHDRFDQYGNFRFWDVATHDLPAISADGKTLVAFSDEMGMGGCRRVVLAFLAVPTGKVTELTHLLPDCMEYPTQPPRSTSPMFATSLRFAPQTPDSPRLRGAASTVAPRGQR